MHRELTISEVILQTAAGGTDFLHTCRPWPPGPPMRIHKIMVPTHGFEPWVWPMGLDPWVEPIAEPMGRTHGSNPWVDPWVEPMGRTHWSNPWVEPMGRTHESTPWVEPMGRTVDRTEGKIGNSIQCGNSIRIRNSNS